MTDHCGASAGGGGGGGASYTGAATAAAITDGVAAPDDAPNGEVIITYQVPTATTTTTVASSVNPSAAGQHVVYIATVSPAPDGSTVAFADGGTTISGCGAQPVGTISGTAICQVTYTSPGTHPITAAYSGDTAFAASTSAALPQTVNQATAKTTAPGQADLKVKLTVAAQAGDGTSVTETVTVTNQGPATASTVVTTLTEPDGLRVTNPGAATVKGRALTWTTPGLAPGASDTFTVTAQACGTPAAR